MRIMSSRVVSDTHAIGVRKCAAATYSRVTPAETWNGKGMRSNDSSGAKQRSILTTKIYSIKTNNENLFQLESIEIALAERGQTTYALALLPFVNTSSICH